MLVEESGRDRFERKILRLCDSKGEMSYWEMWYQMTNHVLLRPDKYYNAFVGGKIHRKHVLKNESNTKIWSSGRKGRIWYSSQVSRVLLSAVGYRPTPSQSSKTRRSWSAINKTACGKYSQYDRNLLIFYKINSWHIVIFELVYLHND